MKIEIIYCNGECNKNPDNVTGVHLFKNSKNILPRRVSYLLILINICKTFRRDSSGKKKSGRIKNSVLTYHEQVSSVKIASAICTIHVSEFNSTPRKDEDSGT